MKKIKAMMLILCTAFLVTGCKTTLGDINMEAGEEALYVDELGNIIYGCAEAFDEDYYDKNELKEAVKSEVEEYNSSSFASVSDAMSFVEFKVKDKVASFIAEFATTYDFTSYLVNFNGESEDEVYMGGIDDCSTAIKGVFVAMDGSESLKGKAIKKMDKEILVVNSTFKVQIDGDVDYVSENCVVDDDGIITTADSGLSYIVYTLDEE